MHRTAPASPEESPRRRRPGPNCERVGGSPTPKTSEVVLRSQRRAGLMTARSAARLGVPGLLPDRDLRHRVTDEVGDPDVSEVLEAGDNAFNDVP